jgi:hypothetical protein
MWLAQAGNTVSPGEGRLISGIVSKFKFPLIELQDYEFEIDLVLCEVVALIRVRNDFFHNSVLQVNRNKAGLLNVITEFELRHSGRHRTQETYKKQLSGYMLEFRNV